MKASQRPIEGKHVLAGMVAFFGVIIAVNLTLAVLANTSWTGLAVENGYVASQHFNAELADARRQGELGWKPDFGYRDHRLELVLRIRPAGRSAALRSRPNSNVHPPIARIVVSSSRENRVLESMPRKGS